MLHITPPQPFSVGWVSVPPWYFQVSKREIVKTSDLGAAYGTARSGVAIGSIGVLKPEIVMKSIIPVIMAGILGIYGMIVSVILLQRGKKKSLMIER